MGETHVVLVTSADGNMVTLFGPGDVDFSVAEDRCLVIHDYSLRLATPEHSGLVGFFRAEAWASVARQYRGTPT